jgi:hypothetical protein
VLLAAGAAGSILALVGLLVPALHDWRPIPEEPARPERRVAARPRRATGAGEG